MEIYKGKIHLEGWHPFVEKEETRCAFSNKGWTSYLIGLDYLMKIIESNSKKM